MARDVFISYSAADKHVADAICSVLESHDISCWIAPRDVLPGSSYGEALVDAISQSRLVVLVFSSQSNNSPQVTREIERAAAKGIPIIPFRIQNVPPSKPLEFFISSSHWLDALSVPLDEHLTYLAKAVRGILDAQQNRPIGDSQENATKLMQKVPLPEPEEPRTIREEPPTIGKDLGGVFWDSIEPRKCLYLDVRISDLTAFIARSQGQWTEAIVRSISGFSLTIEERREAYTIGRSADNDLVLKDNLASRHHAFIYFADGRFTIVDGALESDGTINRSTNGIIVDGKRRLQCALSHGTVISIGEHTITCSDGRTEKT